MRVLGTRFQTCAHQYTWLLDAVGYCWCMHARVIILPAGQTAVECDTACTWMQPYSGLETVPSCMHVSVLRVACPRFLLKNTICNFRTGKESRCRSFFNCAKHQQLRTPRLSTIGDILAVRIPTRSILASDLPLHVLDSPLVLLLCWDKSCCLRRG